MADPSAPAAYTELRAWIVEGRVVPGDRLVEQRIAEELNVSRTPVREALRMRQSEGLVTFHPNRGAAVRSLTMVEIADMYELRCRLEAMASECAATRGTDKQLAGLAEAAADFAAEADQLTTRDASAVRSISHLNDIFHLRLIEAAHNDRLLQTLVRTVDHPLVFQSFVHFTQEELQRSALFHSLIAEAVGQHEPARAGRLTHEHINQGKDRLIREIQRAGSVSAFYHGATPPAGKPRSSAAS